MTGQFWQMAIGNWLLAIGYLIGQLCCSSRDGVYQQQGSSNASVILIPPSGRRICSRWALGGADFSPAASK